MTALIKGRSAAHLGGEPIPTQHHFLVKGGATVFTNGLVVLDAGYLAPGRTATGLITAGISEVTVTNGGASGADVKARVRVGAFPFANSAAGDLIGITEVGKDVYIVDDQTVAKTDGGGTRSRAGKVIKVDSQGVWVLVGIGV